jgi:hypothetical protein
MDKQDGKDRMMFLTGAGGHVILGLRMRARFLATVASVLSLAYLWVVLVTGCLHHHEGVGAPVPSHQCAACAWQTNTVSDAPIVPYFQFQTVRVEMPERFPAIIRCAPVSRVTAARGPPSIFA